MHFCFKVFYTKDFWIRSIIYFLPCCHSFWNTKEIFYLISLNHTLLTPKSLAKEC